MKVKCYCRREGDTITVSAGNRTVVTADMERYLSVHIGENFGKKSDVRLIIDKNNKVEVVKGSVTSNIVVCIWHDQKHFILNKAVDHVKKD